MFWFRLSAGLQGKLLVCVTLPGTEVEEVEFGCDFGL